MKGFFAKKGWRRSGIYNEVMDNLNSMAKNAFLVSSDGTIPIQPLINLKKLLEEYDDNLVYNIPLSPKEIKDELLNEFNNNLDFDRPLDEINPDYKFSKIYIPILRGLRSYGKGDIYWERTKNDYFKDPDGNPLSNSVINERGIEIFTGLDAYKKVKQCLLGDNSQRKLIDEYQKYLSEQFFDNEPVSLIPKEDKDEVLTIKIGDEKERKIYDLGDGIQSIIIMTLPLYLKEKEENETVLVFIEEPEDLLHPGLQRKLIDTFNDERFANYQFFITTHSNHFLDVTLDYSNVSVFSLRKKLDDGDDDEKNAQFMIDNVSYGNTDTLELLGIRNSSVFLSNCTIWIEGVTDRHYIKKYFDIYQNHLKMRVKSYMKENPEEDFNFIGFREDYHFSYVEYAGNNITHWSFLDDESELDNTARINVERLCGKVFLIADRDNLGLELKKQNKQKVERFKKLRKHLGNRFYPLKCKEIENTLSKNTVAEIVREYEEYFNAEENIIGLIDEFMENDELNENSYNDANLGIFIEQVILKGQNKRKSYIDANTIKDKTNFCKKALNHINSYEDLSKEALEICNLLYQFIAYENGFKDSYIEYCHKIGLIDDIIDFREIEKKDMELDVTEETSEELN